MTTGRINQVTARQRRGPPPRASPTRDTSRHNTIFALSPTGKPNAPQTPASTREIRQRNVLANLSEFTSRTTGTRKTRPRHHQPDHCGLFLPNHKHQRTRLHNCGLRETTTTTTATPLVKPNTDGHWDTPRIDKSFPASSARACPRLVERSIGRDYATAPQGPRATQLPASTKSHQLSTKPRT